MSKLSDLQDAELIGRLNSHDWFNLVSPFEMPSVREWLQFVVRVKGVQQGMVSARVQTMLVDTGLISEEGFVHGLEYFQKEAQK